MNKFLLCENIGQGSLIGSENPKTDPINIWHFEIDQYTDQKRRLEKLLTVEEQERASRFLHTKDADQFIVTRSILKICLAEAFNCSADAIILTVGKNKKPELSVKSNISFNVSHSHRHAVVAIAKQKIGIDLEYLHSDFMYQTVADFAFSEAELNFLNASKDPRVDFFRIWTRKEAFLKGLGSGLTNDLQHISCLEGNNPFPEQLKDIAENWTINTTSLNQQYILSIAYEDSAVPPQINLLTIDDIALP